GAESVLEIRKCRSEHNERITHLLLTGLIPVWCVELARRRLADLCRVLQRVYLLNILGIGGVNQRSQADHVISRAGPLPVVSILAGTILDVAHNVMVFIDDEHRPESIACIG